MQEKETKTGLKRSERLLLFGDERGCPVLLRQIPPEKIVGVVVAGTRPSSHEQVQKLCLERQLPFLIQPSFSEKQEYGIFLNKVTALNPDFIFIYSYAMLLREDLLSLPKNGGVNIHAGTLPEYRGGNPIQWEILNQEESAGIALHKVEKTIDSGMIYASKKVPILFSDTWLDIMERVCNAAEEILKENIQSVLDGTAVGISQDETKAVTRKRRTPDDGQFDWAMPSIHIYNLIRALVSPLPGAFVLDSSGKRIEFNSFISLAEVLILKAKVHPFEFTEFTIEANKQRSPKEGVRLELKDRSGKIVTEALVERIFKTEAIVQCPTAYQSELSKFCSREFQVTSIRFVP